MQDYRDLMDTQVYRVQKENHRMERFEYKMVLKVIVVIKDIPVHPEYQVYQVYLEAKVFQV
jgi:hypothetical protein